MLFWKYKYTIVYIFGSKGVRFVRDGRVYNVGVNREVIVSAGAIGSPQILMLSGIGPIQHLAQHQIPVLRNLPVGENLQDHIGLGGLTFTVDQEVSLVQRRQVSLSSCFIIYVRLRDWNSSISKKIDHNAL